jgi:fucose 4-O-acetylase-like acetyltransferase
LPPVIRSQGSARPTDLPYSPRRDESLDVAKGFGILLVVLGHCLDGLIAAKYFPDNVTWPGLAVYVIYLFHMPLFFVVSGHLASGKHRPAGVTLKRLVPTIVYPYFLWSGLEWLALRGMGGYTNGHVSTAALYRMLWIPMVPYWFLYALFVCHVLYLATRRLSYPVQVLLAAVLFVTPVIFMPFIVRYQLEIVLQTVRGFLFFTLGVVSVPQVKQLGRWAAVVATVLFVALAVAFLQAQFSERFGLIGVLPAATAGIVGTLAWSRLVAQSRALRPVSSVLAFFGRYSMSIYVMHIFFTAGVRIALKRLGAHPTALVTFVEIAAAMVAGTLLPLGINWLVSKFELDGWFGLQHMEAR